VLSELRLDEGRIERREGLPRREDPEAHPKAVHRIGLEDPNAPKAARLDGVFRFTLGPLPSVPARLACSFEKKEWI
jgi:hypothetical protein